MENTDSEDTQLRAANGGNLKTEQLRPAITKIRGRRTHALISAAAMAALLIIGMDVRNSFGAGAEVIVSPYNEKRAPMPFDGPSEGTLTIRPATGYKLHDSGISMQDYGLWTKDEENSSESQHIFLMATAYTSQEFVHVDGDLEPLPKPGGGEGIIEYPPFHVSVPAVEINWTGNGAPKGAKEKAEKAVFLTDKTPQGFSIRNPLEMRDDMPGFTHSYEDPEWVANMELSWDTGIIDVFTNNILLETSPHFIPRENWLKSGNPSPMKFTALLRTSPEEGEVAMASNPSIMKNAGVNNTNPAPSSNETASGFFIKLERYFTKGDEGFVAGELSGVHDKIKYSPLKINIKTYNGLKSVSGVQWIPNDEKLDPGAFVHWNIDNDYGNDNKIPNRKHPGADYENLFVGTWGQEKEDDLQPLILNVEPIPTVGKISLSAEGKKARIYENHNKIQISGLPSTIIIGSSGFKTWDLSIPNELNDFEKTVGKSIYIEGVKQGECVLTLKYENAGFAVVEDKAKYTFIAANCGRQPVTKPPNFESISVNERKKVKDVLFNQITHCEWSITEGDFASENDNYNCIAWSVGLVKENILPNEIDEKFGDKNGILDQSDVDAFYEAKGFVRVFSVDEADVIYYPAGDGWNYIKNKDDSPNGEGYHAARRMECDCGANKWHMFESKIGKGPKIEHVWNQLDGGLFGSATVFYKRKENQ